MTPPLPQAAADLDEATLEKLVRAFYDTARDDDVIGPLFARVHDWEAHIARITSFWSSVALMSGTYQGQPMVSHAPLDLHRPHFLRWLALFESTARSICTPRAADYLMEKAGRIAQSMEFASDVLRGDLPGKAGV